MKRQIPTVAQMNARGIPKKEQKKLVEFYKGLNALHTANPMTVTDKWWLDTVREDNNGKPRYNVQKGGKWLIYLQPEYVNKVWQKIRVATEKGKLGDYSKVSTAKGSELASGRAKVICVYTYDSSDKKDVMRVRRELKKLGIVKKICYKTDEAGRQEKYKVKGSNRISKYYC